MNKIGTTVVRKWSMLFAGVIAVVLLVSVLAFRSSTSDEAIRLQTPPFVNVAAASELSQVTSQVLNEAGIAAYFQADRSIPIAGLEGAFQIVEEQTDEYIIGLVQLPGYPESEDVHVYIHQDGWFLAYYLNDEPSSNIIDWNAYDGGSGVPTKLEAALLNASQRAGVAPQNVVFYHFRYPNANRMTIILDRDLGGADSFEVTLPTGNYLEFSWSFFNAENRGTREFFLNDSSIIETGGISITEWFFNASQLPPNTPHELRLADEGGLGLVVLYQE